MKIAVLIPDRGDRPLFLENCLRMIKAQTLQPDIIELLNMPPINDKCDITYRYRIGYEKLRGKGITAILLMENDDWYSPKYIETMFNEWIKNGMPDIFGTNYTIYYHLKQRGYFHMNHVHRSSAMSTLIKPDLNFQWCVDHEPFTDLHLWNVVKGKTFQPINHICMGIKHGIGLCGGKGHVDRLHRYENFKDPEFTFFENTLDKVSFDFYSNYFK